MAGSLSTYRSKRNFAITPEPSDGGGGAHAAGLRFVVQKHWARQLHYDLRLEMDGVMKSWAVPKGPSLDPRVKRMAVQVEDHPIAYNSFEGQIPQGQYGAGKVIIWDQGVWIPLEDAEAGYGRGKLRFELHGHKLQGCWTLVRMHGRQQERQPPWLLIKEADGYERAAAEFDIVEAMPDSVAHKNGASAKLPKKTPGTVGAPSRSSAPEAIAPQLAVLVDGPPPDIGGWAWELKFDGYRLLARKVGGKVRLFTRNGKDWTAKMPDVAKAVQDLPCGTCWLDGEVVALGDGGVPDFQRLQNSFDGAVDAQLVYFVFDLLFDERTDLRAMAWSDRRERLVALLKEGASDSLRLSEVFDAAPANLLSSACSMGFEGIIGKYRSAAYVSRRSAHWIKLKCQLRQEFVIVGYTDPKGSRRGIGSLLLAVHGQGDEALRYVGNVGTGLREGTLTQLHERLTALHVPQPPFSGEVGAAYRHAHWVKPVLLAEVSFAAWTEDSRLRHAVFHGLREDKAADSIQRETPMPHHREKEAIEPTATVERVRVSHAQRVVDPQARLTKLDVVRYYAKIAPLMMEHLIGRPVALMRAPEGVTGEKFFQKHLASLDIQGMKQLDEILDPGHAPLLEVVKPEALIHAAQMNVIEFHTWNARKDRIERPDRMTFDLDPGEGVAWASVQEGAYLVKVLLEELKLVPFLKTSGGKGLHVVVPIERRHGWEVVKGFSKAIVQHLAETIPERFVVKSGPQNRKGKIFVDYLRNGRGATTVSAWSARARGGMGVSVPVAWQELENITSGAYWAIGNIDERLQVGNSVWKAYAQSAISLTSAMKTLGYR